MVLRGKAKRLYQREYMRRKRGLTMQAKSGINVRPKLPWYAGAGNHFGEIRNKRYADEFFSLQRYT